ncbi:hypothetical protein LINPERHAP1_LOCUS3542 [Linum perenne]
MCPTLFHGLFASRKIVKRSTSLELLTWCTEGRLVFNHQSVQNYTQVAYIDPGIEDFDSHPGVRSFNSSTRGSRSQMCNHFSIDVNSGVRRFDNSSIVSPLRFSKRGSDSGLQSASSLQHWFKDWQDERLTKLTASTFGGAIGLWRNRRMELWLEKLGAKEPFRGNLATWWSNVKEKEAIETYTRITQNDLSFPPFQVYEGGEDWIAASPDGVVVKDLYGLPSRGVLEIKCPYFLDVKKVKPWRRVPLYYVPQAQGLMEIMDRDWMDFYVWTPRWSILFRVCRDREYWEILRLALADFWFEHVVPAKKLCDEYRLDNPFMELPLLRPAPRHRYCEYLVNESRRIVDASPMLLLEFEGKVILC